LAAVGPVGAVGAFQALKFCFHLDTENWRVRDDCYAAVAWSNLSAAKSKAHTETVRTLITVFAVSLPAVGTGQYPLVASAVGKHMSLQFLLKLYSDAL